MLDLSGALMKERLTSQAEVTEVTEASTLAHTVARIKRERSNTRTAPPPPNAPAAAANTYSELEDAGAASPSISPHLPSFPFVSLD